tara:strand:- start:36 stop:296 length:261 start_codon:yes stop_codon:yes gene_type:complete
VKQNIINVTIFEEKNPTKDSPLAVVRYTEYSDQERSKVQKVNQVEYYNPAYFHSEILQAVSYGLDVSICTRLSVNTLQKKLNYWTS